MAARSSRVGVNVQRHVGRTKVPKQRTTDQRNCETVRQLQMELDAHGGLVPPPDVFVDGKETCGRSREDHYKFDDTLDYFWQHKKSLQTFKTKTMDTPKVMCAGCAQMMYKTGVHGTSDKHWIKVSKEFVSPPGEAFPSFKHTIEVTGNDPAADDHLFRVCCPCRSLHTRFVPTTTTTSATTVTTKATTLRQLLPNFTQSQQYYLHPLPTDFTLNIFEPKSHFGGGPHSR